MIEEYIAACMNPVRQRIMQHIAFHGPSSAGEIGKALPDVSRATLYRHIKVLSDVGAIAVVEEKKLRGTVERTYDLQSSMNQVKDNKDVFALIQNTLNCITGNFARYLSKEETCDPVADLLSVGTNTILMDDEEYIELLQDMRALIQKASENQPREGRKERSLTIISAPPFEQ